MCPQYLYYKPAAATTKSSKARHGARVCRPSAGEAEHRNTWISGAHWPPSVASMANSRPMRDPVLETGMASAGETTLETELSPYAIAGMHVCMHARVCACVTHKYTEKGLEGN